MTQNVDPVQLRQILNEKFNEEELKTLCFDLNIVYEDLGGSGRAANARELIAFVQRNGRIDELWEYVKGKRPLTQTTDNLPSPLDEPKWQADLEKYYASLKKRVGFVRILGRNEAEPLENVFTHMNMLDRPTAEQRYDIKKLMVEFSPRDFGRFERTKRIAGDEAVAVHSKLFILGKPGAGKTTFMKHTALRAIKHEIKKVPIFVTLKELSDSGKEILPFIVHQFQVYHFPQPQPFVQRVLNNGDAIVLFDGLDEVNLEDNKRDNLIQALNEFVYRYSDCPVLITCRVAATDYLFTQFEYVEMADFDEAQMERYIDHWFARDEVKRVNCRKALLEDESNNAVRELAQVPLLLALLCLVFEERNEFPPQRHEIYEEATRALLSKWDASRNISRDIVYQQLSLARKQKLLATIAAQTFEKGEYFLRERDVVRQIDDYLVGVPGLHEPDTELVLRAMEVQHGIFVERARKIYSFSHLTLQEYFTARYIVDNERRGSVERLMRFVGEDRWREVFLLTAGMLDDATEFCTLYLQATAKLIAEDAQLIKQLNWAVQKGASLSLPYKTAAVRAFLIFRARDLDRDRALALAHDLDRALALALAHDLDRALALARDLDRAFTRDRTLDLDFALALARDRARPRDPSRDRALARARDLARDLDLNLDLDPALTRASDRARNLSLDELADALESLEVPVTNAKRTMWQDFSEKLELVLETYRDQWDIYQKFPIDDEEVAEWGKLSSKQVELLACYLEVNRLLVRCLQVAYVPNRQAIEDRILLPPAS